MFSYSIASTIEIGQEQTQKSVNEEALKPADAHEAKTNSIHTQLCNQMSKLQIKKARVDRLVQQKHISEEHTGMNKHVAQDMS